MDKKSLYGIPQCCLPNISNHREETAGRHRGEISPVPYSRRYAFPGHFDVWRHSQSGWSADADNLPSGNTLPVIRWSMCTSASDTVVRQMVPGLPQVVRQKPVTFGRHMSFWTIMVQLIGVPLLANHMSIRFRDDPYSCGSRGEIVRW